ncbi:MAG TPA: NUDIX hydrolase [Methylomusa anaerophila]|uniref:Nudix hydrolase domain-containing protein n=1 Tax=Methylomusa anaerophila TaxID=1930071 RepID=A0A348AI34_9FIRM|nr:NUDIX hydrolase [Methylomusa anaerophila]BBB90732.1 hypothetical protein MAMMFC1_01393 [Methylomusa anaerophila]HML88665.1 NUDIX hydrolase [Methylomusa anaerophila]
MEHPWIEYCKRIQAIAQAGLEYSANTYDRERYEELREISVKMMANISGKYVETVKELFANESGYQTPKVDIRAVICKDDTILLVREKIDGCWSLPGGWADIGLSPKEVVVKEVREEAGLSVSPIRLLAVMDKKFHAHPPSPYHTYKIFMQCEIAGGDMTPGSETTEVGFFPVSRLPQLSAHRITAEQISILYELVNDEEKAPVFD